MTRSLGAPLAFAGAVGMWAMGYLGRFPGVNLPPAVLGMAFLLGYLSLGAVAKMGRGSGKEAAVAGAGASLINSLVLGSLLVEGKGPHWGLALAGALLAGILLAWLGWRLWPLNPPGGPWDGEAIFSRVAVVAGFLLVVAGGVVTSQGAGLAVPDWPNTFGTNMFLFPLSKMTGGVYYEHAHRLFGSLVGLTTVSLAVYLSLGSRPAWVKRFAWFSVLLVVLQGVLGGLRVTGRFTLAQDQSLLSPSLGLAVAHGVLGQVFLSALVAQAVWLSPRYPQDRGLEASQGRLAWPLVLWLSLMVQLVLGALQRHLSWGILVHITVAVVVLGLAAAGGARLALRGEPRLQFWGKFLVILVCLQFVLGFLAFWLRGYPPGHRAQSPWEVALVTSHQAGGAGLLALVTAIALWTWPRTGQNRVRS